MGKYYVRKHETDYDAQAVFKGISIHAKDSTQASIDTADLLSYITTIKLHESKWRGGTHAFVLHWCDKLRLYEELVDQSDHFTSNVKLMFEKTKFYMDNELVYNFMDNKKYEFWEPEINLTRSYLMAKEPERWGKVDGRQLMVDNFEILKIKKLEPYKIVANIFNKQWSEGFIPEQNYSISDINKLFLPEHGAYALNIT